MSEELDFYIVDDIPEYTFYIADDEEQEQYIPIKGEAGSFKYEKVTELPTTGEDGVLYLVPKTYTEQTASGNPITVTVSNKAGALDDVKVLGNATQADTPTPDSPVAVQTVTGEQVVKVVGKNLIKVPIGTNTSAGVNWTITDTTISGTSGAGTATANYPIVFVKQSFDIPLNAGTYTFSMSGTLPKALRLDLFDESGTTYNYLIDAGSDHTAFTTTYKAVAYRVDYNAGSGQAVSISFPNKLQIEHGSVATPTYEPYQSNSQEINLGKNLFDMSTATLVNKYANTNGGMASASDWLGTDSYFEVQPNTTYTFSAKNQGTRFLWNEYSTASESSFISPRHESTGTFTTGSSTHYIRFSTNNANATDLQIERGSQATSYASYFTPTELAKIGTYQDKIYYDADTSKWMLHKEVGKVILTGSADENWSVTTRPTGLYQFACGNALGKAGNTTDYWFISDNFTQNTFSNRDNIPQCIFGYTDSLIRIITDVASSVDAFKTWLSTHPTPVYYVLATATDTEITNTSLIAQLEAILAAQLANGVNNIMITSAGSNAAGSLELAYHEYDPTNRYNKWLWINADAAYEQM